MSRRSSDAQAFRSLMGRVACLFTGHRWLWSRVDMQRASLMCHYNTNAGMDLDCERCGESRHDAGPYGVEVNPPRRLYGKEYRAMIRQTLRLVEGGKYG
jgi:hypothetical protein